MIYPLISTAPVALSPCALRIAVPGSAGGFRLTVMELLSYPIYVLRFRYSSDVVKLLILKFCDLIISAVYCIEISYASKVKFPLSISLFSLKYCRINSNVAISSLRAHPYHGIAVSAQHTYNSNMSYMSAAVALRTSICFRIKSVSVNCREIFFPLNCM
jgi:hypothetical protein